MPAETSAAGHNAAGDFDGNPASFAPGRARTLIDDQFAQPQELSPASAGGRQQTIADTGVISELAARAAQANASRLKRVLDILGALAGLLALGPFLILVALLIRLESPGPSLFRQRRTGRGGVIFKVYKFRSMKVVEDGAHVTQAAKDDVRVTRLGSFLRRSCVDELPQLLNVLKGEMSLVGPRPHAVAHDEYFGGQIPRYQERFLVLPGIAGLAQVSGHRGATPTIESMAARVALDREYIADWSFAGDIQILVKAVTEGPFHPSAF
jgi:putative colanic acid biosysnthesis UDP-glucose lipid carrier transferase